MEGSGHDEKAANPAPHGGAEMETVQVAGGTNKAASSSTSLNIRKVDEETENLAAAGGTDKCASSSSSLSTREEDEETSAADGTDKSASNSSLSTWKVDEETENLREILCPKSGLVIRTLIYGSQGFESRYATDFDELGVIGAGAYGCVAKCRNKLDDQLYAVKKICLKASQMDFVHLIREVKALARMNHPNIVRYFSAWVEPERVGCFEEPDTEEAGFVEEDELDEEPQDGPCLYIQQELCHSSLKELLSNRVAAPLAKEVAWKIFEEIIRGLHHIHGNKVRHGDLSPANVFFDENKDVKIGDFGLASLNEGGFIGENSPRAEGYYTAPEVKEGNYSLRSDMFSVGIMLFEMFSVFPTSMERHQVLTNLGIKKEFSVDCTLPLAALHMVRLLIDNLPSERPTTEFILEDEPWKE